MKNIFDELHAPNGSIRAHYAPYQDWLSLMPAAYIAQKRAEADSAFHRYGITFAVYGENAGKERLIPFDIVPRIIPAHEWAMLETGLRQRVNALNAFLLDIYGQQRIIKASRRKEDGQMTTNNSENNNESQQGEPMTTASSSLADVSKQRASQKQPGSAPMGTGLEARGIHAWFGSHLALEDVSLDFAAGTVTALIGPSGCGKSTFIRTINRMHEFIPSAAMAGEVLLDGKDIYAPGTDVTKIRLQIGMVFQKPNPFPSMTIGENVLSGLKLAQLKVDNKEELLEECLMRAGLWNEVKDRLGAHAGGLSGGQQQRLCIARSLAVQPKVLLMDEPCSALDPGSTLRIEETISELSKSMTIIIVTHNMQQAARVSDYTAFFLSEGGPGRMVEVGPTTEIFTRPRDIKTENYVSGRFG